MQITSVSMNEGRRFVPVKGWDGVVKTLTLYSNGYTRGARAAERNVGDAIEKSSGALGLGIFLLGSIKAGERSNLVDRLLLEAGQTLERRSEFHKSYDYDAMGTPFMKTSVDIKKFGDDMYGIGLYAAYVGDEPEAGLADHLGIPRALLSCSIEVETKPVADNRFEFDFEPVLRKLDTVLGTKKITGKQVAKAMLQKDDFGDSRASFMLGEQDGLRVRVQPGRVERRMVHDMPIKRGDKGRDSWSVKGSVFSGELARDYEKKDESAKATPTFKIVITSVERASTGFGDEPKPIWRPDMQQKAIDLTKKIAAALK